MNTAFLSLGTNVGNRGKNLNRAKKFLIENDCLTIKESSIYETEPWGKKNQDAFYNQVIEIETSLSAKDIMDVILYIEHKMGRIRNEKWEPRIIDIDILFYNHEIIHSEHLNIPHPHLHERKFVLVPLAEITPGYEHPVLHKSVTKLLSDLNDDSKVNKVEE